MTKEKKVPQAYKKKEAQHPGSNTRLIEILEHVPDLRGPSCNFKHLLTIVLFITIVCSLCGANDWEITVVQAQAMRDWLSRYMDLLDLKGTIITTDALNTQKTTANKAIEKEADYFLPVKGNHPSLQEEIELLFNEAEQEG